MIKKNIFISSIMVTLFTIFIKVLGLIKHTLMASNIGATFETDAFYISTGVIGQLAITIFSALSISLLSMYANKKENNGLQEANSLINDVIRVFIPVSCFITLIIFTFASSFAQLLAPKYSSEEILKLTYYIRIMSFSFIPCCYHLIINVILENEKIFLPGRCRGFFQNLFVIIAIVFLSAKYGIDVLVYSFLLSNYAQAIYVTYRARKYFKISLTKHSHNSVDIKRLIAISVPLIVGNAVYEINDIVDKQISSGLGKGLTSLLTYGATLNEIVTGVIISSVSVILFANFATYVARKDYAKIEDELILVTNSLIILIIPIMILCIVDGNNICNIFYGNGKLSSNEIFEINMVLVGYAVGFIFQAIRANLIKVLYAFQDTKIAMINGIISISANIILSIILAKILGLWGISLSTSLSMFIATILLYKGTKKYLPNLRMKKMYNEMYKFIISAIISSICICLIKPYINYGYIRDLIIDTIIFISIYGFMLYILKSKTLIYFLKNIKGFKNLKKSM